MRALIVAKLLIVIILIDLIIVVKLTLLLWILLIIINWLFVLIKKTKLKKELKISIRTILITNIAVIKKRVLLIKILINLLFLFRFSWLVVNIARVKAMFNFTFLSIMFDVVDVSEKTIKRNIVFKTTNIRQFNFQIDIVENKV